METFLTDQALHIEVTKSKLLLLSKHMLLNIITTVSQAKTHLGALSALLPLHHDHLLLNIFTNAF